MAAKKKKTDLPANAEELATAYYDTMRQEKARHIGLADAIEVTARQRAENEANGLTPYLEETEPEEAPAA
jgi:hypothetical protein